MSSQLARGSLSAVESLESRRLLAAGGVAVAAGDLDGDGLADLAIIHRDLAARNILLTTHINGGTDAEGRRKFDRRASLDVTAEEFAALAIGDVNNDGCPDIIVGIPAARNGVATGAGAAAGAVLIALGDGKGGFLAGADGTPAIETLALPADAAPETLAVGDFDRDGYDDIAVLSVADRSAPRFGYIYWTDPIVRDMTLRTVIALPPELTVDALYAGDVDGDGFADLVAATDHGTALDLVRPRPNLVTWLGAADRKGKLGNVQSNPLYTDKGNSGQNPFYESHRMAGLGDLDGDGAAELIACDRKNGAIIAADFDVKLARWKAPELNSNSDTRIFDPEGFAVGDFDGDQRADIAAWARTPRHGHTAVVISIGSTEALGKVIWSPRSNLSLALEAPADGVL